jgi:hypothetical protein
MVAQRQIHVTVNNKQMNVLPERFYGEIISPATKKRN